MSEPWIHVGGRRSGKTAKMIDLSSERGGYIVCCSHEEAYRVAALAAEMGKPIPFPLTPDELFPSRYGPGVREVYLDNVEMILRRIIRVPIAAITMTLETDPSNMGGDK